MGSRNFCGRPYQDIVGSQTQDFPPVSPSRNHYVLYKIERGEYQGPPKPFRADPQDRWDNDHVKMPYDSHSTSLIDKDGYGTQTEQRWELIERALSEPIRDVDELIDAILSYNPRYRERWTFPALRKLVHKLSTNERDFFFNHTIRDMASLALRIKHLFQAPIPLLKRKQNKSITMSQEQISSILANAFFCTFPMRNYSGKNDAYANYPNINFSPMFESRGYDDLLAKLTCILNYFTRVVHKTPEGVVTFTRRYVPEEQCPNWEQSATLAKNLPLYVDCDTAIEDAHGLIQVDFANKYIGGGVIGHGSVQEEIRFVICPDLMASMLFTEVLDDTEAFMIIGSERYSNYTGYSRTFRFAGDHADRTERDSSGRRRCAVLAIDARPYSNRSQESNRANITRELNKAWVGFSFFNSEYEGTNYPGVATGNWGCGAFGGSKSVKSLIQVMACAEARRPMAYFTFHECELMRGIDSVYRSISTYNVTVGQLYTYVVEKFVRANPKKRNLDLLSIINDSLTSDNDRRSNKHGHRHPRPYSGLSDESEQSDSETQVAPAPTVDRKTRSVRYESDDSKSDPEETPAAIQKQSPSKSPDLFSQDEEQSPTDLTTDKTSDNETNEGTEPKTSEHKMADGDKMAGNKRSSNHTSRLFDEMQKFDENNGQLNLSISSPLKDKKLFSDANTPMDCDKSTESPEVKKKISGRKITDYFSKK